MAINTDSLITLSSSGVTYGKIGVSKSLNQLSINDIWDAVYCSSDNPTLCEMKATFTGETPWFDDVLSPLTFMERTTGRWNYGNQELCYKLTSGADNTSEQLYGRVVWLYTEENPRYEAHRCVKSSNASAFKLITQMNVQQFELLENDLSGGYTSWGNRPKPTTFNDTNVEFMPYLNLKIFEESDTQHNGNNMSVSNVYPFIICKFNDKICLFYGWDFAYWLSLQTKDTINQTDTGKQCYYLTTYDGTDFSFNTSMRVSAPFTTWELDQYQDYYGTDINEQHLTLYSKRTDHTRWREFQIAPANKTALNTWISRFGLYFRTDKKYKPIVVNGYVSGFTDDFTIESEIDNYTGTMQHTVPAVSPSGGGGGGDDDDPWDGIDFGGSSGGGGAFAKFYYMTSTELANLRSWMNSNSVPEGFNPMAQIIGLSQVPVAISGSAPENVVFVNSAAIYDEGQSRAVDSGVATQRGLGGSIIYNLGSVEIPRRMQQRGEPYLDYSCAVELYLPFCGVFSLDTQAVMGRTITAQLVLDPTSGSVTGYAWVENSGQKLPVAYGSGQVGVDLPISAQQYGMSKAALSQANAAFAQSMFQTAVQAMTFAATSGMSSAESAGDAAYARGGRYGSVRSAEKSALSNEVGTYVKSQASSNVVGGFLNWGRALKEISYGNNTAIGGSFGGSYASWSNPFTAYVKIIRPKFQKPSNYNHTQAVPCVEAKTVGSCTGLIQCIGVDTSSITNATSIERDAIAAALSNGVYAGGGN